MTRVRLALLACVAALALAAALPAFSSSSSASATRLVATVGPGFTITLKNASGAKVTSLKAGTYTIAVRDKSNIHNFHLRGTGVNKDSGIAYVGNRTWTVKLRAGTYRYICDPHPDSMKGSFRVRA